MKAVGTIEARAWPTATVAHHECKSEIPNWRAGCSTGDSTWSVNGYERESGDSEEPDDKKGKTILDRFYLFTTAVKQGRSSPQWLLSLHPLLPSLPIFPRSHPPPLLRTRRRPPANVSKPYTPSSVMSFSPISADRACRRRSLIIIDGFVRPPHVLLLDTMFLLIAR